MATSMTPARQRDQGPDFRQSCNITAQQTFKFGSRHVPVSKVCGLWHFKELGMLCPQIWLTRPDSFAHHLSLNPTIDWTSRRNYGSRSSCLLWTREERNTHVLDCENGDVRLML